MQGEMVRTTSETNLTAGVPEWAVESQLTEMESERVKTKLIGKTHHFRRLSRSSLLNEIGGVYFSEPEPRPATVQVAPPAEIVDPLEKARKDRLALLVKQFEGSDFTREDEARISILTARLRRLSPRVTPHSWAVTEQSVGDLEVAGRRLDELKRKYDLV